MSDVKAEDGGDTRHMVFAIMTLQLTNGSYVGGDAGEDVRTMRVKTMMVKTAGPW